ncbi:MAM and LDL-receptor class A domain-containing protein 1 isoform X3 [Nomia melanderi]|uniref:MAM and LDL-receptor class A domain-containing protein 1 isoform X3 n=1 Tax=Nomia melanderi TaxID=2448451 RepID=UPI003FCCB243
MSTRISDYTFETLLGQGTFGSVYLVRRKKNSKPFVVKEQALNATNALPFKNILGEVQCLHKLRHPNIVAYHGAWMEHDHSYILMEYATRCTLKDLLSKREAPLTEEVSLSSRRIIHVRRYIGKGLIPLHVIGCALLVLSSSSRRSSHTLQKDSSSRFEAGEHHANRKSRRHRPNRRFRRIEEFPRVGFYSKVSFHRERSTCPATRVSPINLPRRLADPSGLCRAGSFYYMAPEMFEGRCYDFKCDIWSMGVVLYEMATKRHPFPGTDFAEIMRMTCEESPRPLPDRTSPALVNLISKMLRKLPFSRPKTDQLMLCPHLVPFIGRTYLNLGRVPCTLTRGNNDHRDSEELDSKRRQRSDEGRGRFVGFRERVQFHANPVQFDRSRPRTVGRGGTHRAQAVATGWIGRVLHGRFRSFHHDVLVAAKSAQSAQSAQSAYARPEEPVDAEVPFGECATPYGVRGRSVLRLWLVSDANLLRVAKRRRHVGLDTGHRYGHQLDGWSPERLHDWNHGGRVRPLLAEKVTDSTQLSSLLSAGRYGFLETSQLPLKEGNAKIAGGLLHSPQLASTGVTGTCVMFKYAMDGLSVAGLRVLLHTGTDEYSIKKEETEEIAAENATIIPSCKPAETFDERIIWNAQYYTLGVWQQTQLLYTYPELHSVILEGIPVDPTDPARLYRGYVAVDDIDFQPGTSCVGFCNFAGGFCDWSNDPEDDFDWTISRGSGNPTTGPAMDSSGERSTGGGYAYIDSSFPRRPGDRARLLSTSFPAPNPDTPMCLHFWFHMFGAGIGSLKLFVRHFRSLDAPLREIWALTGNAGNTWFIAEITIGSLDDFQLVFEASVGNSGMGDIAIDDISFAQGSCPVSPQVAAPTPRDCSFEVDECDWINSRDPDRVEWERVSFQALSPRNQRKLYSNGYTINRRNEFFLGLGRPRGGPRSSGGGTAQLISREIKPTEEPLCITFWYFMFESFIDSTGPSLGVLRVSVQITGDSSVESRPIWRLYNNQGPTWNYAQVNVNEKRNFDVVFEATWGPNRASGHIGIDDVSFYTGNCTVKPPSASVRPEDCSFEKGLCGWENITSSDNERAVTWQRAFLAHRPAQLLDKTFGATGDFVFFDIFTNNKKSTDVRLRSPIIQSSPDEESVCFTFWFAAFGVEESTTLQIIKINVEEGKASQEDNGNQEQPLWSLTAKGFNNPRPVWTAAQVTIDARLPYHLVLRGSASNGGFAIDDIKFQPQTCTIRPAAAQPIGNES